MNSPYMWRRLVGRWASLFRGGRSSHYSVRNTGGRKASWGVESMKLQDCVLSDDIKTTSSVAALPPAGRVRNNCALAKLIVFLTPSTCQWLNTRSTVSTHVIARSTSSTNNTISTAQLRSALQTSSHFRSLSMMLRSIFCPPILLVEQKS